MLTEPIPDLLKEIQLFLWSEVVEIKGGSRHAAILALRQVCGKARSTLSPGAKLHAALLRPLLAVRRPLLWRLAPVLLGGPQTVGVTGSAGAYKDQRTTVHVLEYSKARAEPGVVASGEGHDDLATIRLLLHRPPTPGSRVVFSRVGLMASLEIGDYLCTRDARMIGAELQARLRLMTQGPCPRQSVLWHSPHVLGSSKWVPVEVTTAGNRKCHE